MSRSTRITSTGDATSGKPAYLQSIQLTTSGAGRLTLTNGASGGDVKVDIDTNGAETVSFHLSEEGVVFEDGIHVKTANNITAATLVFR